MVFIAHTHTHTRARARTLPRSSLQRAPVPRLSAHRHSFPYLPSDGHSRRCIFVGQRVDDFSKDSFARPDGVHVRGLEHLELVQQHADGVILGLQGGEEK